MLKWQYPLPFFLEGFAHERLQLTLNAILHPLAHRLRYFKEDVTTLLFFFLPSFVLLNFIVSKVGKFKHYGTS